MFGSTLGRFGEGGLLSEEEDDLLLLVLDGRDPLLLVETMAEALRSFSSLIERERQRQRLAETERKEKKEKDCNN